MLHSGDIIIIIVIITAVVAGGGGGGGDGGDCGGGTGGGGGSVDFGGDGNILIDVILTNVIFLSGIICHSHIILLS